METLLSINEAASLLNVHPETLRRWDREGKLVAIKVNSRGDRRYKKEDLLTFLEQNGDAIKYADPIKYKDYSIIWDFNGAITLSASFDKMVRFFVKQEDNDLIGFIFYIPLIGSHQTSNDTLEQLAVEKVKEIIDSHSPSDGERFTFEFQSGSYMQVDNPDWWEEKYSKLLLPGLMVVSEHSCPVTMEEKAWRVILRFKSKSGYSWVTNTFGKNNNHTEYFVWIDAKELVALNLPNTNRGAEILAVQFGMIRFEETKDEDGNRNITRITEKNSARFEGKWFKNRLLPDEMMR